MFDIDLYACVDKRSEEANYYLSHQWQEHRRWFFVSYKCPNCGMVIPHKTFKAINGVLYKDITRYE